MMDEYLENLKQFFEQLNSRGMYGKAGATWPVDIRRWEGKMRHTETHYQYQYPKEYFRNLRMRYKIWMPTDKKSERVAILKFLLDQHHAGYIDIHLYHFGLFLIHGDYVREEDFAEAEIGNRRAAFERTLPRAAFKTNDDFFGSLWSDLIAYRDTDIGDYKRYPSFSEMRILFTADHFGHHSGTHFFEADWVEPIPGHDECKTWVGEKDPMAPQPKKEDMVEGKIILGHEGSSSGLRHFVQDIPIRAGSYIEVKFGDGWIPGRYEWSFMNGQPIQIHSSRSDWINIREGHLVRVRG